MIDRISVIAQIRPGKREELERLQAVDAQFLKKIVVGGQLFARDFEVGSGEAEDFVERLVGSFHQRHFIGQRGIASS